METFAAGGGEGEGGYGGTSSVGGRAVWGDLWQGDGTWKEGAQRGRKGKAGKSEEAGTVAYVDFHVCKTNRQEFALHTFLHVIHLIYSGRNMWEDACQRHRTLGKGGGIFLPPLKHIMGFGFAKTGKTVC